MAGIDPRNISITPTRDGWAVFTPLFPNHPVFAGDITTCVTLLSQALIERCQEYQATIAWYEKKINENSDKSLELAKEIVREARGYGLKGKLDVAQEMLDQANRILDLGGHKPMEDDDDPRFL